MLYILDKNPKKAVKLLADKHLSCSLMNTCSLVNSIIYYKYGIESGNSLYNPSNFIVKWGSKSEDNLFWLIRFIYYLSKEFNSRFNNTHQLTLDLIKLYSKFRTKNQPDSFFELNIPEEYRITDSYQNNLLLYYYTDKVTLNDFKLRKPPEEYIDLLNIYVVFVKYLPDLERNIRLIKMVDTYSLQENINNEWISLFELTNDNSYYIILENLIKNGTIR